MTRIPFPRQFLPVLALVALGLAIFFVATTQPNRAASDPAIKPPTAPADGAGPTVAGAGLVEPSSELIEVGAQRPGVVTRIAVNPGDRVGAGQLLFTVDDRDARARLGEARAAVRLARERVDAARVDLQAAERLLRLYTSVEDPRAVAEQQVIDRRAARDQAAARLEVARAELAQAEAQAASAATAAALHEVRAPRAAEVLQIRTREGQYATAGPAPGNNDPLMILGETRPLHVRIDIDESEIGRAELGAPAIVSPRGNAGLRVRAAFVRTEPLVVPKRSLTNQSAERVDVRVLQLVYALPVEAEGFFVGQQVDAFLPARRAAGERTAAR
ncbi:MAG: efflux RND transporter periplasmic adaptor subunit [Allosphingosinicella sp.]|uniref:efflux RND transporter periplasmic adaptor subunit n=1 Tax=Allosphingosinicella sp. TaxID=2823234 RepID=UPI00392CF6A9